MPLSRAETLIHKLISNKLSAEELSELLEGIASGEEQQNYSDVLENYFNRLLEAHQPNGRGTTGKDADL
ncbi:hypothetical protein [Dyadobacter sandarakinus]|uniref:Uncharacterized protein n=1 Tax=Dyadobacter sandarakinus TaxID=2747268 RepID=A0ABX7I7T0_9BACT|nr:hypothetical protein [Dyadobacter sandarakinus]QRR02149.1 hypothetical protein HWI92_15160 [Dyadobacter sandarakinus]